MDPKLAYHRADIQMTSTLKHQNRIDAWRAYRGGGYPQAISMGPYKVEFEEEDGRLVRLFVWSPRNIPCAAVFVYGDEPAALNKFEYDPSCIVAGNMTRGKGTRDMLTFVFGLLRQKGQTAVQLTDNSTIRCENGMSVRLGMYYFIKHGKTWYEHYFGFKPINCIEEYEEAKRLRKRVLDLEFLKSQPCEFFTPAVLKEIVIHRLGWTCFFDTTWEKAL
jgi:hypothetical protein